MTAQIQDRFDWEGSEYAVAGISEGELFDIKSLGIQPAAVCTACWRGYVASFAVAEVGLVLDQLDVYLSKGPDRKPADAPTIGDVASVPSDDELGLFTHHYEHLYHPIRYTGGVLIADGFISELYVHLGFHPAWKYERVIELVFEQGRLTSATDRSTTMRQFRYAASRRRREREAAGEVSKESISDYVDRAFDRSYER